MSNEQRVLILAPTGADAQNCVHVLHVAGVSSQVCANLAQLMHEIESGAGVLLLAEEGLATTPGRLHSYLSKQEPWSDTPIIILATQDSLETNRVVDGFGVSGNITLLERPLKRRNLITAVRTALRARTRQYEVRSMLQQRDKFLAMLGHELRNPLSPICNGLHLLGKYATSKQEERILSMMERQTTHLCRIVDDLLDVARVINGKINLRKAPLELCELVRQAVEDQRPKFESKGIQLLLEACPDDLWVDADATRLTQVFSNLLVNAWKFTDKGRVRVRVSRTDGKIRIEINDTGAGIHESLMQELFNVFSQADQTLDRAHGGLGLGLALSRNLTELHGGTLTAESAGANEGATFSVELPEIPGPEKARSRRMQTNPHKSRNILIIEDNVDAAESLQMVLELAGHHVEVAFTGESGVNTALKSSPEVVICDIGLPNGMSGFDVARSLRTASSSRLIALTGYGQEEDMRAAKDAGFAAHITKPVDPEYLEKLLSEL